MKGANPQMKQTLILLNQATTEISHVLQRRKLSMRQEDQVCQAQQTLLSVIEQICHENKAVRSN